KVNNGAITQYPYTIDDNIQIQTTHPQYYQLDMEQEDVVVWYCLDGGTEEKSKAYEDKYFGFSQNDVRNNYYIYNKGNVTYSGMGHITSNASLNLPDAEIELFINTFVAAYRATAVGVTVQVTNNDATQTSSGDQYLCVDVDSSDADEIIGNDIVDSYTLQTAASAVYTEGAEVARKSKRVYFRLIDNNAFGNATYDVQIVMSNGDATGQMLAVYEKGTGDFVDNVVTKYEDNTKYYYVDVPIHIENGAVAKTEVKATIKMTYYIGEKSFEKTKDTSIYILPRGLFNLD
ncbi:MAG: hypothetical protein IJD26_03760, partial [Lachnospiraceae bacterium]|nr:hypothetical protein [Lachnospiraceae bacterium]